VQRGANGGRGVHHLGQTRRSAGRLLDLAPDLREILHRIGRQEGQAQQLNQAPRRERVGDHHGDGRLEQQAQHPAEDQRDHQGREKSGGAQLCARGVECALDRTVETRSDRVLLAKGLDGVERAEALAGVPDGFREPILGAQGQALQPAAHEEQGCQQRGDQEQDEAREIGTDDDHPPQGARQGDDVAQGGGHDGADDPLDHGHVRGEP
jgi:hypothetical protein